MECIGVVVRYSSSSYSIYDIKGRRWVKRKSDMYVMKRSSCSGCVVCEREYTIIDDHPNMIDDTLAQHGDKCRVVNGQLIPIMED